MVAVRPPGTAADEIIGRLAERSHGVVTRRELIDAGVTSAEIRHRLRTRALLREHRGVFRVGHRAPSVEAQYLAAVRACGDGAVLSGGAAAYLYGLVGRPPALPEVIALGKRRVKGARTRQARRIDPRDVTVFRGIPITTVPRTLADIAAHLSGMDLGRACHEAAVRYRTTPQHVERVLQRRRTTPDARTLRRILTGYEPVTLSKLERRFLDLLRDAGLPLPVTNRPAGGRYVDCRWHEHALTVELDGYRYHNSRHAWEQDRRREREAYARGDQFRRYTYGDVFERAAAMLSELRRALHEVQ